MSAKYELWYKSYNTSTPYKRTELTASTAPPDTQSKSGYHLVWTGNDPPKQSEPEVSAASPTLPRTLPEIRNHPLTLNIDRCGRVVGQLLASGYEDWQQCQILLQRLAWLAREFDKFLQELQKIPDDKLRQADEAVGEKK